MTLQSYKIIMESLEIARQEIIKRKYPTSKQKRLLKKIETAQGEVDRIGFF